MHPLNILRLNAGIVIDPKLEVTPKTEEITEQLTEARETPRRKVDLKPTDIKSLKAKVRGLKQSSKHVKAAVAALERIPATDFSGQVPHFISELEDLLDAGGNAGMDSYLEHCVSDLRKLEGEKTRLDREEKKEEEYEKLLADSDDAVIAAELEDDSEELCTIANEDDSFDAFLNTLSTTDQEQLQAAMAILQKLTSEEMIGEDAFTLATELTGEKLMEAMHYYNVQYDASHASNVGRPINVVDGTSNSEQLVDNLPKKKNESPEQLRTMDQTDNSQQDKTGNDLSNMMKIPKSITQSLRDEIKKAEAESVALDVRDVDAALFYKSLAAAFADLLVHLEKETIYDFKKAQVFAQTLMGPMLHKIPRNVWKFLTNGGETRSLKSYMTDVSKQYPITGPRNTIK